MQIKNTFHYTFFLILLVMAFVGTGCERRNLILENAGKLVTVNIPVNWSEYTGTQPGSMTLLIYPQNGGNPRVLVSTETNNATTELVPGNYDIYVISNQMDDYDCYDFILKPTFDMVLPDGAKTPQDCGVDKIEVSIPVQENDTLNAEPADITTDTLYPHNVLWTGKVDVIVNGHNLVENLAGEFTGLASSYGHTRPTITTPLDQWESDSSKKMFYTSFKSLGLPRSHQSLPEENVLGLSFTMKDGQTIQRSLQVGDIIKVDSTNHVFLARVATTVNQTSGGYDITVDDWNDEIPGY